MKTLLFILRICTALHSKAQELVDDTTIVAARVIADCAMRSAPTALVKDTILKVKEGEWVYIIAPSKTYPFLRVSKNGIIAYLGYGQVEYGEQRFEDIKEGNVERKTRQAQQRNHYLKRLNSLELLVEKMSAKRDSIAMAKGRYIISQRPA